MSTLAVIEIKPANLRDASWITANMRELDHQETYCQLPESTPTAMLASYLIGSGEAFIAYEGETPVLLFGTSPITVCCMAAWAIGTDRTTRVIGPVSRFLIDEHIPRRLKQGFTSMEARSLATHHEAHRWIESMGGVQHGPAFEFGKGGEYFVLYRWTVAAYRTIGEGRWSK